MYVPDFDVGAISEDYDFDEATDNVIQHLYSEAREHIENELGVKIELPTRGDVWFKYKDSDLDCEYASITVQYVHTGGENFVVKEEDGEIVDLDEEEFAERFDKETLQRLKKAITIYSKIAKAQQKCVSQDVLEKYL